MYCNSLTSAREIDWLREAMNNLYSGVSGAVHEFPPVNVWTNENGALIKAELPGVNPADLDISAANDTLTLKGSRVGENLKDDERYLRRERLQGEFSRTLKLPFKLEAGAVKAEFKNGVLTVTAPRAEADKPRKIAVN